MLVGSPFFGTDTTVATLQPVGRLVSVVVSSPQLDLKVPGSIPASSPFSARVGPPMIGGFGSVRSAGRDSVRWNHTNEKHHAVRERQPRLGASSHTKTRWGGPSVESARSTVDR